MLRIRVCAVALMTFATALLAQDPKAPGPATPQESAQRYFAAMAATKTPDPAPMMIAKFKMTPDQVAGHARTVAAQLKDKALKPDTLVKGQKLARVISSEVTHSNGDKCVVYLDLEKEADGWMISDVNCLVSSQLKSIIAGFKETKDPKAVVEKLK